MGQARREGKRRVFTIGHSNHAFDMFVSLLKQHGIEVLADVRSQPHSRYNPQFDAPELKVSLPAAGIKYLFLGREVGGKPDGAEFYDDEGYVLYDRIAETRLFQEGIARIMRGIEQYRVVLMCSEEDPAGCHRRLLIGRVLGDNGVEVLHIRGDGMVVSEADLAAEERASVPDAIQLLMFESDQPQEKPWRSTRSVSPREPRRTSSEP